jgi:hypothetical protein
LFNKKKIFHTIHIGVQIWEIDKNLPFKNDKSDKSPPVKMTGWTKALMKITRGTKALPCRWQGGHKPSNKNICVF